MVFITVPRMGSESINLTSHEYAYGMLEGLLLLGLESVNEDTDGGARWEFEKSEISFLPRLKLVFRFS